MKTKAVLALMGAFTIVIAIPAGAQSPPKPPLPIKDLVALEAYAYTLVDQLTGVLDGESVYGKCSFTVDYPDKDADFSRMAQIVASQEYTITANPADLLTSSCAYTCKINRSTYYLFYGSVQFTPVTVKGGWGVPDSAVDIPLELSDWIPYVLPDTTEVYVVEKSEDGQPERWLSLSEHGRFERNQGILYLGRPLVGMGRNFEILLVQKDGTKLIYGSDGQLLPSDPLWLSGFRPGRKGVRAAAPDELNLTYQAGDRLIRLPLTQTGTVTVNFPPGLEVYPTAVYATDLWSLRHDPIKPWTMSFDFNGESIKFGAGSDIGPQVIFIRFEYPETPVPLPEPGGKG